jgi:uncharacterized surface protein with fasciclin (FAS1) repeats
MNLRLPLLALALAGVGATAVAQTTPASTTPVQAAPAVAQPGTATPATNPAVGGAPMLATRTIVENAAAAPNLTTLVTAVKAAGLDTTLAGPGPFTVFAPTNDAFSRLAPGTLATLMKPENKASLAKVLSYHVVAGRMTLADLKAKTEAGGGTATLTTVAGQPLTVTYANNVMTLTDPNGNKSYVETPDVMQSNGAVHVVNGVLVPKLQ